jgi:hypothetical protein
MAKKRYLKEIFVKCFFCNDFPKKKKKAKKKWKEVKDNAFKSFSNAMKYLPAPLLFSATNPSCVYHHICWELTLTELKKHCSYLENTSKEQILKLVQESQVFKVALCNLPAYLNGLTHIERPSTTQPRSSSFPVLDTPFTEELSNLLSQNNNY